MAKVNMDGVIDGEAKVVDESVESQATETSEEKTDEKKSNPKLVKGLKIVARAAATTVFAVSATVAGVLIAEKFN